MYIMVLGAAAIVTVTGISALLSMKVTRRTAELSGEFAEARYYAQSAVELGMLDIRTNSNWRTTKSNGAWRTNQTIGRGTLSLTGEDPADGLLGNDTSGHVLLTGTGNAASARFKLTVELEPDGPAGLDCLASSVHTQTLLTVGGNVTADAPISSNGAVVINLGATVSSDVEAVGLVTVLGSLNGEQTQGITAKEVPASTVFDSYIAQAVAINIASLPTQLLFRELTNVVLSPTSNPYGATHPQGMYLINCMNTSIRIKRARILGTLILLDPGLGSEITGGIHWERFNAQLPALMVRGNLQLAWTSILDENVNPKTNFNPLSTSYQGLSDADTSDTYPSKIKGLIYVSGTVSTTQPATLEGALISAGISTTIGQTLTVTHDPTLIDSPPPGFERTNRPMIPVAGSWHQVVD